MDHLHKKVCVAYFLPKKYQASIVWHAACLPAAPEL